MRCIPLEDLPTVIDDGGVQRRPSGAGDRSRINCVAGLALVISLVALAQAAPASAATFPVNKLGDRSDRNLNDGVCNINDPPGGPVCTLRAAIQEANHAPGADTITFNIPGEGVKTISPGSALPSLIDPVTIDGYTQPGATRNTKTIGNGNDALLLIELNGTSSGAGSPGLDINGRDSTPIGGGLATPLPGASGSIVRGLVINRFANAIQLQRPATIEGNFIGTDPTGTIDRGNSVFGIFGGFGSTAAVIGGGSPGARNVISGNDVGGIATNPTMTVQGNYIGTTRNGRAALGNRGEGLALYAGHNIVGGVGQLANVIAFNERDGIQLANSTVGSSFSRNSIFSNGEQGIDLNDDGVTPNDDGDIDVGPNELQNFPAITSAITAGGQTTVGGHLRSNSNEAFTLEFFSNSSGDTDEGQRFIGAVSLRTLENGQGKFSVRTSQVAVGDKVTATATDSAGSTSEFSVARGVVAGP